MKKEKEKKKTPAPLHRVFVTLDKVIPGTLVGFFSMPWALGYQCYPIDSWHRTLDHYHVGTTKDEQVELQLASYSTYNT